MIIELCFLHSTYQIGDVIVGLYEPLHPYPGWFYSMRKYPIRRHDK